jgi:L-glutamine:2-deoxy-scyllo-inosose/3-amino-2,3-dideoxy-scyllo-inosose aminotransferase
MSKISLPAALGGEPLIADPGSWPEHGEKERDALLRVLEGGHWAYDGPAQAEFEQRFAAVQGVRHVRAVANGTTALQLALEALDVGRGDEVIVPGLTWQATAAAVADVNALPVLVDVEPDTYCVDLRAAEAAITERTKAIIVVHLYGSVADLGRVLDLARRHDLSVVEDCAHAHGASWAGRGLGSVGDLGCFSFQSSKTLTAGEGGCVTSGEDGLIARVYSLSNCGRAPKTRPASWQPVQGGNYRMTEWQAAVLCAQLDRFPSQRDLRERVRGRLDAAVSDIPGLRPMLRREEVTVAPAYAYVLRYEAEEFGGLPVGAVREALSADLGCKVEGTYEPLNRSSLYRPRTKRRHQLDPDYFSRLDPSRNALPISERAASEEAIVFAHTLLLNPEAPELLSEAVDRLRAHLPRLLAKFSDRRAT